MCNMPELYFAKHDNLIVCVCVCVYEGISILKQGQLRPKSAKFSVERKIYRQGNREIERESMR